MILQFNVTGNPHRHRQFCTVLDDVYLKNTGKDLSDGSAAGLIEIIHDDKLVKAGIDKDTQKMGDREIYYPNQYSFDTKADIELDEEIFLLFDDAGINYQHFFFDLFGKCIYYDELLKTNPSLIFNVKEKELKRVKKEPSTACETTKASCSTEKSSEINSASTQFL